MHRDYTDVQPEKSRPTKNSHDRDAPGTRASDSDLTEERRMVRTVLESDDDSRRRLLTLGCGASRTSRLHSNFVRALWDLTFCEKPKRMQLFIVAFVVRLQPWPGARGPSQARAHLAAWALATAAGTNSCHVPNL